MTLYYNNFDDAEEFIEWIHENWDGGSEDRGHQFSDAGWKYIYDDMMEVCPDDDVDIVALCCSYTEYDTMRDYKRNGSPCENDYAELSNGHLMVG